MYDERASEEAMVDIAGIVATIAIVFVVDGSSSVVMVGSQSVVGVSVAVLPYNW